MDVEGNVNLSYDKLTKIPLKFGRVSGHFTCRFNGLITLNGCPNWIGGNFSCSSNQLKTLEGGPKFIGGNFNCPSNYLKTLEGGPKVVVGNYVCNGNRLVNFKGFPEDYEGNYINFHNNIVYSLLGKIQQVKWIKFIYWCNEFDVITDEGKVIPERMEEVYNKIGLTYED